MIEIDSSMAKALVALIYGVPGIAALAAPGAASRVVRLFPDNFPTGRILSAVALLWAAALIYFTPLDFIAKFKLAIAAFLLASIPLSWQWMRLLLAARSLGALWCLAPAPILVAVRFAPGAGRLVAVSLCYVMAVAGMASLFSPYLLRDFCFWLADGGRARMRAWGALLAICGAAALL